MKHIMPIFLARSLAQPSSSDRLEANRIWNITLKRTKAPTKNDDGSKVAPKAEVKIMFSPQAALEIDISRMPPDEDWTKSGTEDKPYNQHDAVECEVLRCFLEHGLPKDVLEAPLDAPKRKRKIKDVEDSPEMTPAASDRTLKRKRKETLDHDLSVSAPEASQSSLKRKQTSQTDGVASVAEARCRPSARDEAATSVHIPTLSASKELKKRGRPRKTAASSDAGPSSGQSAEADMTTVVTAPRTAFQMPRQMPPGLLT